MTQKKEECRKDSGNGGGRGSVMVNFICQLGHSTQIFGQTPV